MGGVAAALLGVLADHSGLETVMWAIVALPWLSLALALHAAADRRTSAQRGPRRPRSNQFRDATHSDVHVVGPARDRQAAASLPGIDAIRKIAAGELPPPPIAELLDFEITLVEPGRVIFAITPEEWMYNPIGSVHGGVAATLLDSSLGCAIHTVLAAGQRYTTTDLHVRYVRAMTADTGRVLADSRVVHVGPQARHRRGPAVRGGRRQALRARDDELPDPLRRRGGRDRTALVREARGTSVIARP